MAQYRIFQETISRAKTIAHIILGVVLFIVATELARVYELLSGVTPVLGYLFITAVGLVGLAITVSASLRRHRHRILNMRGLITDEKSSQKRLARSLAHHIHVCKRIASQTLLSADQKKAMRQGAHDLQKALEHHPLRDDLRRGIDTACDRIIQPALRELDQINTKVAQAKVRAVIEDYYQPYFPALAPWIVVYHQFTLVSEVADIYLPQPSLGEYIGVIRDTWTMIRRGDLLHHGQRYFSSIEAANAPLGDAANELVEAVSIIWMTHCVAQIATLRCTTYHDWDDTKGIATIKGRLGDILMDTRDSIMRDALPILKRRLYRHGNVQGRDIRLFADETIQSFIKSMDAVIKSDAASLRVPPVISTGSTNHPGINDAPPPVAAQADDDTEEEVRDHHHPHRQRRRRSRSSFRRFIDKLTGRDFHF